MSRHEIDPATHERFRQEPSFAGWNQGSLVAEHNSEGAPSSIRTVSGGSSEWEASSCGTRAATPTNVGKAE
jgi:hypothetical protein